MNSKEKANRGNDDKLLLKQDMADPSLSPNDSLPSQNLSSQHKTAWTDDIQWNQVLKKGAKVVAIATIGFGGGWCLPTVIASGLGFQATGIVAGSTAASLMSAAATSSSSFGMPIISVLQSVGAAGMGGKAALGVVGTLGSKFLADRFLTATVPVNLDNSGDQNTKRELVAGEPVELEKSGSQEREQKKVLVRSKL
ncbi:uncharacterized protein LOC131949158 [Physella acuta]|uniref:uncharacterized protein LOC131949158 n=1 Tax=Physella acuta TaxID=109671 RepID=UPI0027DDA806|nr:uncharacterized protein LOC131949158 [Physella acuta]